MDVIFKLLRINLRDEVICMGENNIIPGVGLVLSGGGGKGSYQIGVLKALKENGYLDDIVAISGASIGTVNAMLYSMDDMDIMHRAWEEIDMSTVFDVDLERIFDMELKNLLERIPYFSREGMIKMMEKYINFDKLKNGKYSIFASICKLDKAQDNLVAEYRKLQDYNTETIKKILLASTALPLIYESVEIDGEYYRDGGICDNEPIKPLYDMGIRQFIIVGLNHNKVFKPEKWPDANFVVIYPSHDLGDLVTGTLNFTDKAIDFRERLGYKDGLRAIKTKFEKDDIYIKMEPVLAQNDYNEIKMQMKAESAYNRAESSINSHIDYFNKLAEKYDKY